MQTNEHNALQVTRAESSAHLRSIAVGIPGEGWFWAERYDTILEDTNCLNHTIR